MSYIISFLIIANLIGSSLTATQISIRLPVFQADDRGAVRLHEEWSFPYMGDPNMSYGLNS